jgi:hypothetical protein
MMSRSFRSAAVTILFAAAMLGAAAARAELATAETAMAIETAPADEDAYLGLRIDTPFNRTADVASYGVGIYPINVSRYLPRRALMPYGAVGGTLNVVVAGERDAQRGGPQRILGGFAQARAVVGMRYFPSPTLAVTTEVGYAHWSSAMLPLGHDAGFSPRSASGMGAIVDLSFGVEWR